MAVDDWLQSEKQFEQFYRQVEARLRARRAERNRFLARVVRDLDTLIEEARALRDEDSLEELEALQRTAQAELDGSTPPSAPADPPAEFQAGTPPTPLAEPGTAKAEAAEVRIAADPADDTPLDAEPVPAVLAASSQRPAEPETPVLFGKGAPEVAGAPPVEATASAPAAHASRWKPRERAVVDREVAELTERARKTTGSGDAGLLQLKALAARLRRAYAELEALGAHTGDVRAARGLVQARIRDDLGAPYVAPLDTNIVPADPAEWEELARRYEALGTAFEAYDWFNERAADLKTTEAADLLEGIGAVQQRLFRLLDATFHARDDQQRALYSGMRECADGLSIFLQSIGPATDNTELERLARRLEKTYADLRGSVDRRLAQEASLAALQQLLAEPSFGAREEDAERLQAAASACLLAGVPKTKPELRNALLDWEGLLEEGPGLDALRAEIAKEKERQARKSQSLAADEEDRSTTRLSPELEKLRQELLPYTRGKRCLFVGGHVREEHRQRIQQALELAALEWPETDRFDASPSECASEVRRSDIVVLLIRFMRTGMKKTSELCKELGKPVVRLPRGLNAARVVTNFHEQLVPRGG